MKRLFLIFLFCFVLISNVFAWRDNEMEIRVFYNNDIELGKLIDLQPKGDIYPNGEALIYVIPSEFNALKATGLIYQIEREDVKTYAENFWTSMDNTREAYHTYAEIVALADSLVNAFPTICEKHLFGTSVQGRELGALKISDNVSLDENESEVMFDGGIHGDEVGAAENCIRFARDLCREYGIDPDITDLIDNREIWIYYMVNPDGRVADNRYNANGVDCNRDSGYMWDGWGNSSGAFSQPESKALRDCHYNRQFVVHTTYHSGTEYISCPWSYRADQCPDLSHILQLAGEYSSSSGYANMEYGQGCTGMYPINGSTKDTNYGMMGAISWSMEISYQKHPSTSLIMQYYNYNKPAMLSMIEHSGYGLEGVVTDANTGEPVTAAVFIDNFFPCYTDPVIGDYHKYVLPGTYNITIVANGYETQTITGVTVTANNSTATDFQLTPQDGHFAYKICSSRIPDNNTADEGDTPGVIGAPDSRNYSIGKNGWVVVDMQYPIPDGPGNDIIIYEGDTSAEGFTCYAGEFIDGPWHSLGTGNGTSEFDLATGSLIDAQFVKIIDDGDGVQTTPNAGFDLDAVGVKPPLNPPTNLLAEVMNYNEVELTWDAPALEIITNNLKNTSEISADDLTRDLIGYNVYLDGDLLEEMIQEVFYNVPPFGSGDYNFFVTAVYDNGESIPSNILPVIITLPVPQNPQAVTQGADILITWDNISSRAFSHYKVYRDLIMIADDIMDTSYLDPAMPNGTYTYNIRAVYSGDFQSALSADAVIEHVQTNTDGLSIPTVTELTGIYPNPFNPRTTISFSLSQNADVSISVFNIKGQKIRTLVSEKLGTGYHQVEWRGIEEQGKQASSGVYFVIMDVNNKEIDFTSVKKIILLK